MESELLKRDVFNEKLTDGPCDFGRDFALALWTAYSWVTRLRYGVLPQPQYRILVCSHTYKSSDVPNNYVMQSAFLLLFAVFVVTSLCTVFCDPGKCATQTKDLRQVREIFSIPIPLPPTPL